VSEPASITVGLTKPPRRSVVFFAVFCLVLFGAGAFNRQVALLPELDVLVELTLAEAAHQRAEGLYNDAKRLGQTGAKVGALMDARNETSNRWDAAQAKWRDAERRIPVRSGFVQAAASGGIGAAVLAIYLFLGFKDGGAPGAGGPRAGVGTLLWAGLHIAAGSAIGWAWVAYKMTDAQLAAAAGASGHSGEVIWNGFAAGLAWDLVVVIVRGGFSIHSKLSQRGKRGGQGQDTQPFGGQ
jgi:hypothetical protein